MNTDPKIYVALPAINEAELLPLCLKCIENQSYRNFHIVICINQPDDWWEIPDKKIICENNVTLLKELQNKDKNIFTILDKCSKGNGWKENSKGVGWARKTIMDHIVKLAKNDDIIVSLDADTIFSAEYFSSIVKTFLNTNTVALANPYYHKLADKDAEDRAILRYEIYMRNYAINLLIIDSPYAFTALGSAIALPVSSYKAIGGLTPKLSGEDFYFLQKLRKFGNIVIHNTEKVYPAARFSDRVFFGTGPAMIKGNNGDWDSYPIYHFSLFENIKHTYECFTKLFYNDCETPLTVFLQEQFKSNNIWQALRENHKDEKHFIRACHEKLDGLRILQYLKQEQDKMSKSDEQCLRENITTVFSNLLHYEKMDNLMHIDFSKCSLDLLNEIRNYLVMIEGTLQKKKITA
jgi:glycosyltransferase involved in cell wall biosynthesis